MLEQLLYKACDGQETELQKKPLKLERSSRITLLHQLEVL